VIYLAGDTHGRWEIETQLSVDAFPEQLQLTKRDSVIVLGDFGLPWNNDHADNYYLKWLEEKSFTTLFIDGNHENFSILEQFHTETWNGGTIHRVSDSIIHLTRGQVFCLEGKTFFTFGGASSYDKFNRMRGISWSERELPTVAETEEGLNSLDKYDWKVDYVLTHTCSSSTLDYLADLYGFSFIRYDTLNVYFQWLEENLAYQTWFFGHFHHDRALTKRQQLLYRNKVRIL
jgi:DNA repair exonuclease SbcCD nuclease subunit